MKRIPKTDSIRGKRLEQMGAIVFNMLPVSIRHLLVTPE